MSSRYHKSQRLVGLAKANDLYEQSALWEQINFHKTALNRVRWALAPQCKHLIHVRDGEGISVRAIISTKEGEQAVNVETGCAVASELRADHYKQVKEVLDGIIRS